MNSGAHMSEEDKSLVDRLHKGSETAFHEIFVSYYAPLCAYASLYVSEGDAEEVVQAFMVHLWEGRENICVESSLKSYLFVAVRNRCLNAIRDRRYKQAFQQFVYERLKDRFDDPDSLFLSDMKTRIAEAVQGLPEHYRQVFEMSRSGNSTNREIAEKLGVSVKTVEYYITQSLKILRVKLKDYLYFLIC